MELLGQLHNERACKAFTDYLSVHQIDCKVEMLGKTLSIYVAEQHLEQAGEFFDEFVNDPNQEKYLQASWQLNEPVSGKTQSLGLTKIWQANGPLTKLITLLCIGIYFLSVMGYFEAIYTSLSFNTQIDQFYRIFTPAIMHLSAVHLAFNMSWWWYLGGKVENHFSLSLLLMITLITGVASNIAQALLVDNQFAGLSGVNYGLAGFVWLFGKLSKDNNVNLPNNIFGFLMIWMVLGFADILPINMANWAHLFGLLTGLGIAKLVYSNKKADQ